MSDKKQQINEQVDEQFREVLKKCEPYVNDCSYVYKLCTHTERESSNIEWFVILQKIPDETKTNEERKNVVDKSYAKFRANKLKVIDIFNVNDPSVSRTHVVNCFTKELVYKIGEVVIPDSYDENIDNICSGGIHYFKTPLAACFYRSAPENYTGIWMDFYDNGQKQSSGMLKNGKQDGLWVSWHENGKKKTEGNYYKDEKTGSWTLWNSNGFKTTQREYEDGIIINEYEWIYDTYSNGNLMKEGIIIDSKKEGHWIQWYKNGVIMSEGDYVNGKKTGHWVEFYDNKRKKSEGAYYNEKKIGWWTFWYNNGQKITEGSYVNGQRIGEWTKLYVNGVTMDVRKYSYKINPHKRTTHRGRF